jgi:L-threonylcarbamoyladenylate synthase
MKVWSSIQLNEAIAALRDGAIIAYPTEAVFGLGCDPENANAVARLFELKKRSPALGFLVIGASEDHFNDFVDWKQLNQHQQQLIRRSWPGPNTWIMPTSNLVPKHVVGAHVGIAVRVTAHVTASLLCQKFGGALISTSANLHGYPSARSLEEISEQFAGSSLHGVINAPLGGYENPSEIRSATTGDLVRG